MTDELTPDQMSKMHYVRPRLWVSVRRRLLPVLALALICGGVVAIKSVMDAVLIGAVVLVVSLLMVTIEAYGRHSARWEWWQAGAAPGGDIWGRGLS